MNEMYERSAPPRSAPFQANQPMSATLEAQEWNVVFQALNDAPMPMRVVRVVFDKLLAQFNQIPLSG